MSGPEDVKSSRTVEADTERAVPEIIRELEKTRGLTFDLALLADIYNDGRVDSLPEAKGPLVGGTVRYDEAVTTEEAIRRITNDSKGYSPRNRTTAAHARASPSSSTGRRPRHRGYPQGPSLRFRAFPQQRRARTPGYPEPA